MDTDAVAAPSGALETLGSQVRKARQERGLSQEQLAQPEFTKSYISAVERGKARPSLKALALLAARLGRPMTEFLAAPAEAAPDPVAVGHRLVAQLDQAELLLDAAQAPEGLRQINAAEQAAGPVLTDLAASLRLRLAQLRARAYLQLAEPDAARPALEAALALAQQMDDGAAVAAVHNLLGLAYYRQGLPRLALEQHDLCLQALRAGLVPEPGLGLSIYQNLANDYWALKEDDAARQVYEDAQAVVQEVRTLERQAAGYRGLSRQQHAVGDCSRAQIYAGRALQLAEIARTLNAAAALNTNRAALQIEQQAYVQAEALLVLAQGILQFTGNDLLLSLVYEQWARLELQQGRVAPAGEYAQRSLQLSEQVFTVPPAARDPQARLAAGRSYARALRVAGLIAEERGDSAQADTLFQHALTLVDEEKLAEIASEIELTYADILAARGAHEQAATHYRAALQQHQYGLVP